MPRLTDFKEDKLGLRVTAYTYPQPYPDLVYDLGLENGSVGGLCAQQAQGSVCMPRTT